MGKPRNEARDLVLAPGALAALPAAALLLDADGAVTPLNEAGAALSRAEDGRLVQALAGPAAAARAAGAARILPLAPLDPGEALMLPLADAAGVLVVQRDAMLEHKLREALVESRQRYKDLVEISSDFAWETDAEGRFVFVSPRGVAGWPPEALLGREAAAFLAEPGESNVFAATAPATDAELWFRRPDGGSARLGLAAMPVLDAGGRRRGARGVGRDLTTERERADMLAHAQLRDRLFTHLVRAIRDELEPEAALAAAVKATGLALGAAGGVVLRRIDAAMMTAASWGEMPGEAPLDAARAALAETDATLLELAPWQLVGRQARYRGAVEGAILMWRRLEDGGFPEGDRALLADVADQLGVAIAQVAQHERVVTLSRTDPLTGLLNRRAFFDELGRRLRRLERDGRAAVLLYVDMDNFKLVNDRRGHRAGDEAILALCRILRSSSRSGDLLARLGGDEFALWLDGLAGAGAQERAQALLRASAALAPLSGDPARPLGISIGLAPVEPPTGETPEQLLARADAAMYRAKQAGKGGIAMAEPTGTAAA
jgi:diguanylate cyclase (GGDEF)-like protein/PAS domain S-box-containing protein